MKRCSKCGESLPLDAFALNRRNKDGRQSNCRSCYNDARAARRGGAEAVARRALRAQAEPGVTKVCFRCRRVLSLASFGTVKGLPAIRCRDCNRELEQTKTAGRRALADEAKYQPCMDCGVQYPAPVMEFDHRPGVEKVRHISGMVSARSRYSLDDIREEIAKCDVVCANCHRMRTAIRGGWSAAVQTPASTS